LFYIAAGFVMLSLALIITLSYIQKNKLTV